MAGHSVDEYLETIYFLAFPIGEYRPHARQRAGDRLPRGRDAGRLARVGRRDAEAARGRRASSSAARRRKRSSPWRARARREGRAQAPHHRAAPHRLHGLYRRRGARARGRAGRHVQRRHGRTHRERLGTRSAARTAGRSTPRSSRRRTAARALTDLHARPRARSSGWQSTTASCCTGSTTRGSCPARAWSCARCRRRRDS